MVVILNRRESVINYLQNHGDHVHLGKFKDAVIKGEVDIPDLVNDNEICNWLSSIDYVKVEQKDGRCLISYDQPGRPRKRKIVNPTEVNNLEDVDHIIASRGDNVEFYIEMDDPAGERFELKTSSPCRSNSSTKTPKRSRNNENQVPEFKRITPHPRKSARKPFRTPPKKRDSLRNASLKSSSPPWSWNSIKQPVNDDNAWSWTSSRPPSDIPQLYGFVLLGDANFVNLASYDMGYQFQQNKKERRCGYCFSSLRLRDARDLVMQMDSNICKRVVINVGAVDIIEGRSLAEIIELYQDLLQACKTKQIQAVPTTLPPIANCLYDVKKKIAQGLNQFIRTHVSMKCPIIDLYQCMVNSSGDCCIENFYQKEPTYVKGVHKPIVLWNTKGRKRVAKMLDTHLGFARLYKNNYVGEYI